MLSRYKILKKLGAGGMGVVYKAEDIALKRPVALKFLTEESFSQEQLRARFLREAQMAASLNHPNVCTIYEVAEVQKGEEQTLEKGEQLQAGIPFISMELIEGKTLSSLIQETGALSLDKLIEISMQIAEGLVAAHSQGIVHRDLKPQNVMITKDGRVKILDFGLAKPTAKPETGDVLTTAEETISAELTKEGRVLGTAAYMSPEQAQGKYVDSRSDIFAFGIMLYEMAAGTRPFRGDTPTSTMAKILVSDPEPIEEAKPDLPQEIVKIIYRCLRKKPEERYNDTRDLLEALKDLKQETTSEMRLRLAAMAGKKGSGIPSSAALLRRRKVKIFASLSIVLMVIIAIGAYLWFFPSRKPEAKSPPSAPEFDLKRVAVTVFENQTADKSLDHLGKIASDRIGEGISGIESVEVVPTAQMSKLTRSPMASTPVKDPVLELAEATGAGLVVSGRYYLEGQAFRIQAKVTLAIENRLLQVVESPSLPREKAMEAVETLRKSIVWIVTVAQLEPGLLNPERKPPSNEVYQEWRKASELLGADNTGAIACYKRILELEPGFVLAHICLVVAYANASNYFEAAKQLDILERMKERLTPMEWLLAKSFKAGLAGRREESLAVSREIVGHFPHSTADTYNLALAAIGANRPREAIEVLSRPLNWKYFLTTSNPFGPDYFFVIALALHQLGEHEQELAEIRRGRRIYPESVGLAVYEVIALLALGRLDEMETVIQETLKMPARPTQGITPGWALWGAAMGLRKSGHREASLEMAGRGVEWFRGHPGEELKLAQCLYLAERWQEALTAYEALAREHPEEFAHKGVLGCLAVRRGDPDEAMRISEELRRIDRPYLFGVNTRARASIAAQLGQKDQAVSLLREAVAQGYAVWDGDIAPYTTRFSWDPDLEPLRGYPPFEEMIRPKG